MDHLVLQQGGEVPALGAGGTVVQLRLVVAEEGIDREGAYDGIVRRRAGVGVEGQREVYGDAEAAPVFRIDGRAAGQVPDPGPAAGVVVGVVEILVLELPAVETGPLHGVHRALEIGGHAGSLLPVPAGDLAHAPAEADGVGRDVFVLAVGPALGRDVVQGDEAAALFEFEGPQIDPGAAADALVDDEFACAAPVPDGVMGAVGAALDGLVGDVDGVAAALGQVALPLRLAENGAGGGDGPGLAGGAHAEGIVIDAVDGFRIRESLAGGFPVAFLGIHAAAAERPLAGVRKGGIIVRDDFQRLGVPLPRGHDHGPCVFQHRDEEGQDEALGKEVLGGLESRGALPFPAVRPLLEITAVALPEGDVTAFKALGRRRPSDGHDQRPAGGRRRLHTEGVLFGIFAVVPGGQGDQGGEVLALDVGVKEAGLAFAVFRGHERPEFFLEPGRIGGRPGIVGEFFREAEVQHVAAALDAPKRNFRFDRGPALHPDGQRVAGAAEFRRRLGGGAETDEQAQGQAQEADTADSLHERRTLNKRTVRTMRVLLTRAEMSATQSQTLGSR